MFFSHFQSQLNNAAESEVAENAFQSEDLIEKSMENITAAVKGLLNDLECIDISKN